MIIKVKLIVIFMSIFISGCLALNDDARPTQSPLSGEVEKTNDFPTPTITQDTNHRDDSYLNETFVDENNENEELMEKQRRKGQLDLNNIEIIGVEGELLKTIKAMFKAIETNDDQARLKFVYDPEFDEFKYKGPYILAMTKLELDETRVSAVTDEYRLNEIADRVAIVKISMKTLDDHLDEIVGTGDYIFIRVDQEWYLYRFQ